MTRPSIAFIHLIGLSYVMCDMVILKLYTHLYPDSPMILTVYEDLLYGSTGFCPQCSNYIIIHGWGNGQTDWMVPIKDELFKQNKYINVFLVDWSAGSNTMTIDLSAAGDLFGYETAIKNINQTVRELHAYLSQFVRRGFISKINSNTIDLTCIGHSLGGQVCGLTGKLMKTDRAKFARISALDPAGPCFDGYPEQNRLHIDDAAYVDVIHTSRTFGYKKPIGHSDYYPHDGTQQPGCYLLDREDTSYELTDHSLITVVLCNKQINFAVDNKQRKSIFKGLSSKLPMDLDRFLDVYHNMTILDRHRLQIYLKNSTQPIQITLPRQSSISLPNLFSICSHSRSTVYYIESMKYGAYCQFYATQCASWELYRQQLCSSCDRNRMGYFSQKTNSSPTTYYLNVNYQSPYCIQEHSYTYSSPKDYCNSTATRTLPSLLWTLSILTFTIS